MPPSQYASISGAVMNSLGGGLAGAKVVITPTGASPLAAITTSSSGAFSASTVPVTNAGGSIAVSNVPFNCVAPPPTSYQTLAAGRTLTVNIPVTCQTPADSLTGTITSSSGAPQANVSVVATPTNGTAMAAVTTNSSGAFVVTPIALTGGTITLSGVPADCETPLPVRYASSSGATATVNITLTCSSSGVGVVTGTVSSSLGGSLPGVAVTVTPHGRLALPAVPSNASGVYTATGVPVSDGTGSVTLSNLPSNCSAPNAAAYGVLVNGGTLTVNITVPCS
jgi:large repetitive protein